MIMKVLNFSAIEILPALLNKTKTQTIRPAWGKYADIGNYAFFTGPASKKDIEDARRSNRYNRNGCLKPPHFKVGETVRLEWKSRSSPKGSIFCRICGQTNCPGEIEVAKAQLEDKILFGDKPEPTTFPKILRTVEITEVFKIEMGLLNKGIRCPHRYYIKPMAFNKMTLGEWNERTIEDLAKRDGFPDSNSMFDWFDKNYDLKTPKTFWVYRWRWVDES